MASKDVGETVSSPTTPSQLHSILVNPVGVADEEEFFKRQAMRPRANTDPISPRPRLHVTFDLPDIVVDDCSDNDEENLDKSHPEEINAQLRNTDEGAFFVFKSPPRQRANTCPKNMFSRQKPRRPRPPTPPPADDVPHELPRHPSWEKVQFSPHSLSSVDEVREVTRDSNSISQESSDTKGGSQDTKQSAIPSATEFPSRSRKTLAKPKAMKARSGPESPTRAPTKTHMSKLTNGHVPSKSPRDHVIHSTA